MNLILLGAPGAGKGTQALELSKILKIPHISTGVIFRDNIKRNTELGIIANSYISQGKLVPDEITIEIIKDRLSQDDCEKGFILDGFPRTIPQAKALEGILGLSGRKIDWIINIVVDDDIIVERLSERRVCPVCGETYHTKYNPAKDNLCGSCGAPLTQRDDDKPEVIRHRMEEYHKATEPLVDFYRHRGKLLNVRSEDDISESLQNTLFALGLKGL